MGFPTCVDMHGLPLPARAVGEDPEAWQECLKAEPGSVVKGREMRAREKVTGRKVFF
jgi:hypothetical protein